MYWMCYNSMNCPPVLSSIQGQQPLHTYIEPMFRVEVGSAHAGVEFVSQILKGAYCRQELQLVLQSHKWHWFHIPSNNDIIMIG